MTRRPGPAWWTDDAGWWTYLGGVAWGIVSVRVSGVETAAAGLLIVAAVRAGSQLRRHRAELLRELDLTSRLRIVDREPPGTGELHAVVGGIPIVDPAIPSAWRDTLEARAADGDPCSLAWLCHGASPRMVDMLDLVWQCVRCGRVFRPTVPGSGPE